MEFGHGLAIDAAGNAYVSGTTKSSNFPTTAGAFDRSLNIPPNCPRCATDNTDGFVFKLNAASSALTYSTYLGGTDIDSPRAIAVDGSGNAYVTGETLSSTDVPTTAGAFSRTLRGEYDMFVTKLNPGGTALAYSTFLGGTLTDDGARIRVDAGGNAYATGGSRSTDSPTTAGAVDPAVERWLELTDLVLTWLSGVTYPENEELPRRHASIQGNALAACCRLGGGTTRGPRSWPGCWRSGSGPTADGTATSGRAGGGRPSTRPSDRCGRCTSSVGSRPPSGPRNCSWTIGSSRAATG